MTSLVAYRGLDVLPTTPAPAAGGGAISDDLRSLVDWNPKNMWEETTDPTAGDDVGDDFYVGSTWRNSTTGHVFVCVDNTSTAAVWKLLPGVIDDGSTAQYLVSAAGQPIVLSPDLSVQMDDAGDTRGNQAIDLQNSRTDVAQVASGNRSMIAGGQNNKASGAYSVSAGNSCTASGEAAVALGTSTSATAAQTLAHGRNSVAGNVYTEAGGYGSNAFQRGQWARSTVYKGSKAGAFQASIVCMMAETTSGTPVIMSNNDDSTPNNAAKYRILANQTVSLLINVVGRKQSGSGTASDNYSGMFQLLIHCSSSVCTIVAEHPIHEEKPTAWGGVTFNEGFAGGSGFGYLEIKVAGAASTNIRWHATILASEVVDP